MPFAFGLRPFSYPAYPSFLHRFAMYFTPYSLHSPSLDYATIPPISSSIFCFRNWLPIESEWCMVMGERQWLTRNSRSLVISFILSKNLIANSLAGVCSLIQVSNRALPHSQINPISTHNHIRTQLPPLYSKTVRTSPASPNLMLHTLDFIKICYRSRWLGRVDFGVVTRGSSPQGDAILFCVPEKFMYAM